MARAHSDETRATVVACLLTGQSVTEIARQYKLDKSVVSRIKTGMMPETLQQVATEKRENLDNLILCALESNLKALNSIATVVAEADYVRKQPAESIGVLYGILSDKAIRIIEAAQASDIATNEG